MVIFFIFFIFFIFDCSAGDHVDRLEASKVHYLNEGKRKGKGTLPDLQHYLSLFPSLLTLFTLYKQKISRCAFLYLKY